MDPNMQYTRVREGEVKCVQKEIFSQEHTVNATCLMFFYAAMRRKKVWKNSVICKNHICRKNTVWLGHGAAMWRGRWETLSTVFFLI